jgi:hypothetical protein
MPFHRKYRPQGRLCGDHIHRQIGVADILFDREAIAGTAQAGNYPPFKADGFSIAKGEIFF